MGLDIYLKWFDDFEATQELEAEYEKLSAENWKGRDNDDQYGKLSDSEKKELRDGDKKIAESLGLDKWGTVVDESKTKSIEFDCKRYPDHYFNVGYFRSSYNEGGIERILRNLGLRTMEDIFNYDRSEEAYYFRPDWENALKNVKEVIGELKEKGGVRCFASDANIFKDPTIHTAAEAITAYEAELKRKADNLVESGEDKGSFDDYSNSIGQFHLGKPLEVVALIPGTHDMLGERDCTYVITKVSNDWYIEALEIVQETIEYVLNKEDKEKYYLSWSG